MNITTLTGTLQRLEDMGTWVRGTIRVTRSFKNKDTGKYESDLINFKAFQQKADVIKRFHTGREGKSFGITGELQQERWEDKEGNKRETFTVMVNSFDFPPYDEKASEAKKEKSEQKPASSASHDPFSGDHPFDLTYDDVPF